VYCAVRLFLTNLSMVFVGTQSFTAGFALASSSKENDVSVVTLTPSKQKSEKAVRQGPAGLEDTGKAIFLASIYLY
jgi:hypothetical protein